MGPNPRAWSKGTTHISRPSMAHLLTDGPSDGHREESPSATPQILPFPLLAEGFELFLLLLFQCRAVLCLG